MADTPTRDDEWYANAAADGAPPLTGSQLSQLRDLYLSACPVGSLVALPTGTHANIQDQRRAA